jgi:para-nitrobenzyl esterase
MAISDRDGSRRGFLKTVSLVIAGVQAGGAVSRTQAAAPTQSSPRRVSSAGSDAIAETTYGKIRGITAEDGIKVFKGVPYGGNMTGTNRFMPPTKPTAWTGVRDAVDWGSKAPQVGGGGGEVTMILDYVNGQLGRPGEDCLVLNIWTPALKDGRKRPVMFRIHGGGFTTGTGNHPMYWGHASARRGDVVFVNVNHRLGCLGFLHLGEIGGPEYGKSGNAGMLDLVAALQWVRDNIENFGGDPNNVLIFGESGGGAKTATLLGMPAAKGLFHRAGIESGPSMRAGARDRASQLAELFLRRLGLDRSRISELHKLPLERLMEAQQMVSSTRLFPKDPPPPAGFGPILDPQVIPQHMFDPTATPLSADVPLVIGTTRDEAMLRLGNDDQFFALDEAGLRTRVQKTFGGDTDSVIALYHRLYPKASPSEHLIRVVTDSGTWINTITLAERKVVQAKASVYMFRFDWQTPSFGGKFRAIHGSEIPFVLDNISSMQIMTHDLPEAHSLATRMNASWIAFARSGNPNIKELPQWPAYTTTSRATMLFDNMCKVENDPDRDARLLWTKPRPRT